MAWINHFLKKSNKDSRQNTIVSDDIVEIFPKPNEKISSLIQKIPLTSQILFLYKQEKGISEEWKSWAWEMMENGYDTPGIIQLAGEDLSMNPFEFSSLANIIFKELELDVTNDDAYYQYALGIARQVLKGEISSEKGFKILAQAAIDTNYHDAFMEFYYLEDNADLLRDHLPGCYGDGTMREDNIEEWMHLYFEKLIMFNDK
ncbi:MAG: hypothetical protein IJV36_01195 [Prevotella sp.]|nr:hypothetical protein [Prevotella sp.]